MSSASAVGDSGRATGELRNGLTALLGADAVITDPEEPAFYSTDVYGPVALTAAHGEAGPAPSALAD